MIVSLDLDRAVLDELRRRGRAEGKSPGQVASEVLARTLADLDVHEKFGALDWRSRDLGRPSVDLENPDAVRCTLEDRE